MGYGCLIPTNIFILQKVLIYGYIIIIPAAHLKFLKTLHFDLCHMPYAMYVIYVKYVIYEIFDMYGALTYTICMYVNMGVK